MGRIINRANQRQRRELAPHGESLEKKARSGTCETSKMKKKNDHNRTHGKQEGTKGLRIKARPRKEGNESRRVIVTRCGARVEESEKARENEVV